MNKSNEWRVIIGQRERDGQRIGASGRKPEIICLENLRNEREQLHLVFFPSEGRCGQAALHMCTGHDGGKVTTHAH